MRTVLGRPEVRAILGPTNTGKTHRAIQRMLARRSGMIGLPLRLLAREVYDRVVQARGADSVALITGEEKQIGRNARYFVCTVEAMPVDRKVEFLAVDEVQLAGDRGRGHVFTDRILHARGLRETLLLGSENIGPLLARLVPGVIVERQPRLSRLSFAGVSRLASLPRRSAVVAFRAEDVYRHAERLRSLHGGTAVVMGALSPRTRNAQVALYQGGDVRHLVATDAIGMGLNLDLHHVAFAAVRKFDGRRFRALGAQEVAQIAGRAGRFRTDGTFGTTREAGPLEAGLVAAVESHRFAPLTRAYWRNAELDYRSPEDLLASLRVRPPAGHLVQVRDEDDERALETISARADLRPPLDHPDAVERLWEVCRIPDYRKTLTASHVELLAWIAAHLLSGDGGLPEDQVAQRIGRLDETTGDIETLMARIAYIRTWTYVAYQRGWLADPAHWQGRTRAIEDRLSDALHDRLTERFVDRRAVAAATGRPLEATVLDGVVSLEGRAVARLAGLDLTVPVARTGPAGKRLWTTLRQALGAEVRDRVRQLLDAPDSELSPDDQGRVVWRGTALGRLGPGEHPLRPRVRVHLLELLDDAHRELVRARLARWVEGQVAQLLAPLERTAQPLRQRAADLVAAVVEGLGSVASADVRSLLRHLDADDRRALAQRDLRLGTETVFVHSRLKPRFLRLRALLFCVHHGLDPIPPPADARPTARGARGVPAGFHPAVGYRSFGDLAVRVDVLEKVAAGLRGAARQDGPVELGKITSWMGCDLDELAGVARGLGYSATRQGVRMRLRRRRRRR